LPVDYRGLPRPSSAPGAKASTVCHTRLATTETRCSRTLSTNQTTSHTPDHHPTHPPPQHRRTSRPGVRRDGTRGNTHPPHRPHRIPAQGKRLLPQTPNSAPPPNTGSTKKPAPSREKFISSHPST